MRKGSAFWQTQMKPGALVSWLGPSACHSPFVSTGPYPAPRHRQLAGPEPIKQVGDKNPEGASEEQAAAPAGPHGRAQPPQPPVCPPRLNARETCWPCPHVLLCDLIQCHSRTFMPIMAPGQPLPVHSPVLPATQGRRLLLLGQIQAPQSQQPHASDIWKPSPTPVPKGGNCGDHQAASLP